MKNSSLEPQLSLLCGNTEGNFKDFLIVNQLAESKFPVFLISIFSNLRCYAMKIFPYVNNYTINPYYINEARFIKFKHINIITPIHCEKLQICFLKEKQTRASVLFTEYAPYGDFLALISKKGLLLNETTIRTYFHQLIEGLEYLHSQQVYHLDLKPENLLLRDEFKLAIIDFDMSCIQSDDNILSSGTRCFRACEVANKRIHNPAAADIFSAGILLFVFKSGGILPQFEDRIIAGVNLFHLMNIDVEEFWLKHCELQKKEESFFSQEFRELFISMTKLDPEERATIEQIKESEWYGGPVFSDQELIEAMEEINMAS
jgi:serine/threonine protein kinase